MSTATEDKDQRASIEERPLDETTTEGARELHITPQFLIDVGIKEERIDYVLGHLDDEDFLEKQTWVGISKRKEDVGLQLKAGEYVKIWKKFNSGGAATEAATEAAGAVDAPDEKMTEEVLIPIVYCDADGQCGASYPAFQLECSCGARNPFFPLSADTSEIRKYMTRQTLKEFYPYAPNKTIIAFVEGEIAEDRLSSTAAVNQLRFRYYCRTNDLQTYQTMMIENLDMRVTRLEDVPVSIGSSVKSLRDPTIIHRCLAHYNQPEKLCFVTGAGPVLVEGAHIMPLSGFATPAMRDDDGTKFMRPFSVNDPKNIVFLRKDLHDLFDIHDATIVRDLSGDHRFYVCSVAERPDDDANPFHAMHNQVIPILRTHPPFSRAVAWHNRQTKEKGKLLQRNVSTLQISEDLSVRQAQFEENV